VGTLLLSKVTVGTAMKITNNDRKVGTPRVNILLFVTGMVTAVSLSIVLLIYSSFISDDALMFPAILLNIISLAAFLFRPRKLVAFWIGFMFTLLAFNGVMYIATGKFYSYLLFSSTFISILLLLLLPQYFAKTSTKTLLPSATDQINVEQLGSLYSWIFLAQIMFLTILVGSNASMYMKGLGLFVDMILYLIAIYEFDQRVKFKVSPLANVFKIIIDVLLNIFRLKYTLNNFIESIERLLHRMKCSTKPVIEELGNDLFLGALISLPLATIIIAFSNPSKLDQSMITIFILTTAILFTLSTGTKLYRKCHINLMMGILLLPLWFARSEKRDLRLLSIAFNAFVYIIIGIVLAVIAILLSKVLSIWLLILFLILILASLIFTILFILSLTTVVALAMISGYLSQILTLPMNQPDETTTNLILLSIITFTTFTAFSSITCLRHNVGCDEE